MDDSSNQNPWKGISPDEYESHMDSRKVNQLKVLNELFRDTVDSFRPGTIAVAGCTTGNGFEHLDPGVSKTIIGIDINLEFLAVTRTRYQKILPDLVLLCSDIRDIDFPGNLEMVYAGLLFEYVNTEQAVRHMARWIMDEGILSVVLQQHVPTIPTVSPTPYPSLQKLSKIMKLVEPGRFDSIAIASGFQKLSSESIGLKKGKYFYVAHYAKQPAA